LQNIRSKGPLLVIVIGLALYAFIAGDAWKAFQPYQSQDIGEINGQAVSAQDYQKMVEEYTEIVKFTSGMSALSDEQNNQLKDEVWRNYVNQTLIENEAAKLGLTVSKEEIQAIIDAGVHPALQQTPFRNTNGMFDKDMLKKFLVDYANMQNTPGMNLQMYEPYYNYWIFIEKSLRQSRLAEKYQALISKSILSNPVEAQAAFEGRVNQTDLLLAAVPYTAIPDSTVNVTDSEIKNLYNKRKEQYRQYNETRNIQYINVQINASPEDREALEREMLEYTEQLVEAHDDYSGLVRQAGSEYSFTDLYYNRSAYPADVIARLDSVKIGEVYGPYYNVSDNTLNTFKLISKNVMPDSIEYRQIQVYQEDLQNTRTLADSIYNALKGGAGFAELAEQYSSDGMGGVPTWVSGQHYENTPLSADDIKYLQTINSLNVNEIANLTLGQANVIIQVTGKKVNTDKYKVAVIKRPVDFSTETYNKAYNSLSQFIAANPTLKEMTENAEENGYTVLPRKDLYSAEHTIAGIRGSKEAIRWAFENKVGEVSPLYESGNGDQLLVVAVEGVTKEGYQPINQVATQLRMELIREKKAEKIIGDIKSQNVTSFTQASGIEKVITDTIKHVTFAAPAYISALYSSEPVISGIASVAEVNKLSTPVKGNGGVVMVQVYEKEKINEEYDAKSEEATLANRYVSSVDRFIQDLYLKANVKDNRYLYF
ncbi:MAG: SurA N-terminal domain-containing protein, partial [Bacteroides sp.]|nr:SurA N-terminal domain-containing protein [Bacteroides sp.]